MAGKRKKGVQATPAHRPRFTKEALEEWSTPGTFCDPKGRGLYLQVTQVRKGGVPQWKTTRAGGRVPKVRMYWTFRYWRPSKDGGRKLCEYGIGPITDYSPELARKKAAELRRLRDDSIDPIEAKRQRRQAERDRIANTHTFEEVAQECWRSLKKQWKPRHAADWLNSLKIHVFPSLVNLEIRSITTMHVEALLRPIWWDKAETASRVRGRIETVFNFGKGKGWFSGENPAIWVGNLDALLMESPRLKKQKNYPSLPYGQMPTFMAALRAQPGIAARALEFGILTAARSGETRLAEGREFDLEKKLWTVPAERMKAGKEHLVPLSNRALEIIRALGNLAPDAYVFPGSKPRTCQSDTAMLAVLKRMDASRLEAEGVGWRDPHGDRVVPHGFRATFKTWAAEETEYPRDVIEFALAHSLPDKVEAAYIRATMLEKRRPLMADWATFCATQGQPKPSTGSTPRIRRIKNYDGPEPVITKIEMP